MSFEKNPPIREFDNYVAQFRTEDAGWGTSVRRQICLSACKYLGIPVDTIGSNSSDSKLVSLIKNGLGITYHSVLHSPEVCLDGSSLEKVKSDSAFISRQNSLISEIKSDSRYCKERFSKKSRFSIQFGGRRARGDMWSQTLGFWKHNIELLGKWL